MLEQLHNLENAGQQWDALTEMRVEAPQDDIDSRFNDIVAQIGELRIDNEEALVEEFMEAVPREPGGGDNWRLP